MKVTCNTVPAGKYFERQLWISLGTPLGRGRNQDPRRLKIISTKFLDSEVKKLPPRMLILKTFPLHPGPAEQIVHIRLRSATAISSPNLLDHITAPPMVGSIKIAGVAPHSRNRFQTRLTKIKIVPALPKKDRVQNISSSWDQLLNTPIILLGGSFS